MTSDQSPIHLVARFEEKDHFLQNYMYHVPTGGLFVDLGEGTNPPLLAMDRRELVGRVAEVRVHLADTGLEVGFRGAITYASPFRPGVPHRRIGIEFFRYESRQKEFLLHALQRSPEDPPVMRKHRRYPVHLRVRYEVAARGVPGRPDVAQQGSGLLVTGRTEDLGLQGCSFQTVRFLQTNEIFDMSFFVPDLEPAEEAAQQPQEVRCRARVRWATPTEFGKRLMGVEFQFGEMNTKERRTLETYLSSLQQDLETELLKRRRIQPPATT